MPLRVPPGRAGQRWLVRRIEVARRGADVLEQKRHALLRELLRLRELAHEAEADWRDAASEAAVWLRRAGVMAGERPLRLARLSVGENARIELTWRNALGAVYPSGARLVLPQPRAAPAAGSVAVLEAAQAHRHALEAAARFGALQLACDRIGSELGRTMRRLRAIEHRWLPWHERALRELELVLDEREREEAVQIQWARRQSGRRRASAEGAPDEERPSRTAR